MKWFLLTRLTEDCKAYPVDAAQAETVQQAQVKLAKRNAFRGTMRIKELPRGDGQVGKFYRARRTEQLEELKSLLGVGR